MDLNKEKILIFKTDRVGDLILFSPCLTIIKNNTKNSHITLVCSEYNYKIAKNYKEIDKYIIVKKGTLFKTLINNFRLFFLTNYKYLFQFDGKSSSYKISFFVKSKFKSTICFIKNKRILGLNFTTSRPAKIILKIFFNNYVFRDENYANEFNKKTFKLYQNLYFDILGKLNFKINTKQNQFNLDEKYRTTFENFHANEIKKNYYLFHIDERWDSFNKEIYQKTLRILNCMAKKNKIVITTGIKDFSFLCELEKKFLCYDYINNEFFKKNIVNINNAIIVLKKMPLNLLAYFIKNSDKNFSAHSGPVVHIGAAFNKEIIDIVEKDKNNELDRWIPVVSNYKRFNFENLNNDFIENFNF